MVYKPTYNWKAPSCTQFMALWLRLKKRLNFLQGIQGQLRYDGFFLLKPSLIACWNFMLELFAS